MSEYEVWRERWQITQWKDDAVYGTVKLDEGWWDDAEVRANLPRESNLLYVRGGENCPPVAIRRKKVACAHNPDCTDVSTCSIAAGFGCEGRVAREPEGTGQAPV